MGKKRSALAVWVMAGLFSLGFSGAPAMAETVTGITAGTVDPETGAVTLKTGTFSNEDRSFTEGEISKIEGSASSGNTYVLFGSDYTGQGSHNIVSLSGSDTTLSPGVSNGNVPGIAASFVPGAYYTSQYGSTHAITLDSSVKDANGNILSITDGAVVDDDLANSSYYFTNFAGGVSEIGTANDNKDIVENAVLKGNTSIAGGRSQTIAKTTLSY